MPRERLLTYLNAIDYEVLKPNSLVSDFMLMLLYDPSSNEIEHVIARGQRRNVNAAGNMLRLLEMGISLGEIMGFNRKV